VQSVYQARVDTMVGQWLPMMALYRVLFYLQVQISQIIPRNGLRRRSAVHVPTAGFANVSLSLVPVGTGGRPMVYINYTTGADLRGQMAVVSIILNVGPLINLPLVMATTTVTAFRTPRINSPPPRSFK
jgi:hypothetical protein